MRKSDIVVLLLAMLFAALPLLFWNHLQLPPDAKIPTHFNIHGEPDSWIAVRAFPELVLWMGFLILIVWGVRFIYPKRKNIEQFRRAYNAFVMAFGVFLGVTETAMLLGAAGVLNPTDLVMPSVGALLGVAGVVTFISRQNWAIGLRTPWGLESEKAWKRSNRIAGMMIVISGFLLALTPFCSNAPVWAFWTLVGGLVWATTVAYVEWRRDNEK